MPEHNGECALTECNERLDLDWGEGRLSCGHGLEGALKDELSSKVKQAEK